MDDVLEAPPSGHDDLQLLAACLAGAPNGVDLAYRLLDRMAERHRLDGACLVVRPPGFGPQVFVRGRVPAGLDALRVLLARPSGLYGAGPGGDPGSAVGAAVAGCCELALAAEGRVRASAGGGRSVATRWGIELVLTRAASRSARYGWPVTALLVKVPGFRGGGEGYASPAAALAAVARVGDEVGEAGEGRAMAVLGDAGPEVVSALVDRLRSVLGGEDGGGDAPGGIQTATVFLPDETVDPDEVWRLAAERLADDGVVPASWHGQVPSDLELELRALPGVVSVGAGSGLDGEAAVVTVVATADGDALRATVTRLVAERFGRDGVPVSVAAAPPPRATAGPGQPLPFADANGDVPVPVGTAGTPVLPRPVANGWSTRLEMEADPPAGALPQPPRVALLRARFDSETGTSEVTLRRGAARATGRASAGPLAGGAQATLAALGVLGVEVPFYVLSVERARSVPGEPVVAVLAPRRADRQVDGSATGRVPDRVGAASGAEEVEAASRATLAALNRFLASMPATATLS